MPSWRHGPASMRTNNPYAAYIVYDTFEDAEGTALESHVPNKDTVGSGWVAVTPGMTIKSNKASDNQADRLYAIDAGAANATLTGTTVHAGENFWGFNFRYVDSSHYYIAGAEHINNRAKIWLNNAGWSNIGTGTTPLEGPEGTSYTQKLVLSGSFIVLSVDGNEEISITDGTLSGTSHGIYVDGNAWTMDGTMDDFGIA